MDLARVKRVLDEVKLDPKFPFPVEFVPTVVDGKLQIEAGMAYHAAGTGEIRLFGIAPEYCSVKIALDSDDFAIAKGAHDALQTFLSHEASEVTSFRGKHIVEPHPEA